MKDTSVPLLLSNLFVLLQAHRSAFRQERTFLRAVGLLLGELFAFARHTVTQGLLALGLTDADWSAWYRLFSQPRYEEETLSRCLFRQTLSHVAADEPYVLGVDGVQVSRSSLKMPGTAWLKAPRTPPFKVGIHRAQRFVHAGWLLPIEQGYSRAIPLRWLPAFPAKAVAAPRGECKEWEAAQQAVEWVRQQLDQAQRARQPLLVLGDGAYDNRGFWQGLPERVVAAVRTARNRVLWALPGPYAGRGRRRKYGARLPAPADWLAQREGWQTCAVSVRGRSLKLTYRVVGPCLRQGVPTQPVFLIVVRGSTWMAGRKETRRRYRKPCFYLVSAVGHGERWELPWPAEYLLAWLWQRWELEVTHRELKSGLGLGEKQCWNARSTVLSVQWSAWVYALLVLAGFRTWGLFGGPKAPARWWPGAARWSLTTLWRAYRAALWGSPDFRAVWTATGYDWLKKEARIQGLWNAVAGAARC